MHEDGVVGLFLATKTQEIFQCIADEHVTEEKPLKMIKKEDIIDDMKMRAAVSDFHPVKQILMVRSCNYLEIILLFRINLLIILALLRRND